MNFPDLVGERAANNDERNDENCGDNDEFRCSPNSPVAEPTLAD
jgi:hypothetical protein